MNKKVLLGLIGTASLSLSFCASPVMAADTTNSAPNSNQTTATNTTNNSGNTTDASATSNSNTTSDSNASSTSNKPNTGNSTSSASMNHALSLIGKVVKTKRTSYVYNKNGKRLKKSSIKKNTMFSAGGFKTIKNKIYIEIAKGRYVKAANLTKFKSKLVSYKLKRNALIYNSRGKLTGRYYKKSKNKTIIVIATKKIKGKKFVKTLDSKQYIKWADLDNKSGQIVNR